MNRKQFITRYIRDCIFSDLTKNMEWEILYAILVEKFKNKEMY